jgi:hypothetical protein
MNGELTNEEVLERNIPWESYKITSQIADREYALIKRLDKSTKVIMCSAMEEVPSFSPTQCAIQGIAHNVCWMTCVCSRVERGEGTFGTGLCPYVEGSKTHLCVSQQETTLARTFIGTRTAARDLGATHTKAAALFSLLISAPPLPM